MIDFKHHSILSTKEMNVFLSGEGFDSLSPERKAVMLDDASSIICSICKQFFEKRDIVITVDGNGGLSIPAPFPILSVSKVELSKDSTEEAFETITDYKVYRNKIARIGDAVFTYGNQNVRITADWGCESVPPLIKKACKLLILDDLRPGGAVNSRIISENIGGHSVSLEKREQRAKYTGNLTIDNILVRYVWQPPKPRVTFGLIP